MIETTAIRKVNNDPFIITWDLGRRCNYDCTYCEAKHHNLTSRHRTLDELIKTFEFIREWVKLYRAPGQGVNIDFTGGEPTVNPNFWKLIQYIRESGEDYYIALTSNGTWGKKNMNNVIDNVDGVTISYHAEADDELKKKVVLNILALAKTDKWMQVNMMLHQDYWDECCLVYEMLRSHKITVNLRPLGDGAVKRTGWFMDVDGTMRRTSHEYTKEQQEWFWRKMGITKKADNKQQGTDIGRQCCGGRCLEGCVEGNWQPITLIKTEFKGWHCSVDKYFLHIDQETELVYHHQTCQATYNGTKGAIGSLSDIPALLNYANTKTGPIVCPNKRCGCGMCVPKAKSLEVYNEIC